MKKITALVLVLLFSVFLIPLMVSAAGEELIGGSDELNHVTDTARLLTDMQQITLAKRAEEISNKFRCDMRIVTVNDMADYGFRNIEVFSDYIYTQYALGYGSGGDCALFVLSTADRDYDLRVWGNYGNTAFTLYGIDDLLDSYVLKELKNDNYYAAFTKFLDRAEVYLKMADEGKPFDSGTSPSVIVRNVLILVFVSLLISGCICWVWRGKMKTAKIARTAGNYIPQGGFRLTGHGDIFMYRTVTRRKIQTSSSSSGGASRSGGSSGRSGKY